MLDRVLRWAGFGLLRGGQGMEVRQMRRVIDEDGDQGEAQARRRMSPASMPPSIASAPDLIRSLRIGTGLEETLERLDEQKVSFIYGNLPASSLITREQVAAQVTRSKVAA